MKKGFTLVELLAVIIILGVLSVLIVPKVISTLNDSEHKANQASAYGLLKAAQYKFQDNEIKGITETLKIDYTNNIGVDELDYDGKKPEKGYINIGESGLVTMAIKIGDKCYKKDFSSKEIIELPYNENTCKYDIFVLEDNDSNSEISIGDQVKIGTESFYVIDISDTTAYLLAKYPLYIDGKIGTGIQDELALTSSSSNIEFSNSVYWDPLWATIGISCVDDDYDFPEYECVEWAYVYNNNTKIYPYIETYIDYLKQVDTTKLDSITGRLIKMEEYMKISYFDERKGNNMSNWIYSTNYWTGSAVSSGINIIPTDRIINDNDIAEKNKIRPVIEAPLSAFDNGN